MTNNHLPAARPTAKASADGWSAAGRKAPAATRQHALKVDSQKKSSKSARRKNKFEVLCDPADDLKGVEKANEPPAAPANLKKLDKSFAEFRATLEPADLLEDFSEFGALALVPTFVTLVLQHILDTNAKHINIAFKLLETLFKEMYSKESLWTAFNSFLVAFEDDKCDFPNGFKNLSQLLVKMLSIGYLSKSDLLCMAVPLAKYAGIRPAGAEFLGAFLESMSHDEFAHFMSDDIIPLGVFWPPDSQPDAAVLKKWCGTKKNLALACAIERNTTQKSSHAIVIYLLN